MNYCDKIHYYLYTTENASFGEMVDALLMQLPQDEQLFPFSVLRHTPEDNRQYAEHCAMLRDKVYRYCGDQEPALSYVSQPPLNAGLLLEVHSYKAGPGGTYNLQALLWFFLCRAGE